MTIGDGGASDYIDEATPPRSIEVQGMPIRPGDPVLLLFNGKTIARIFEGVDPETGGAVLRIGDGTVWTTDPRLMRGPFAIGCLRHPDVLGGFIREVDAAE